MTFEHISDQHNVSNGITLLDDLAKYLEDRDHTESEILQAIEIAIKSVYTMPENEWQSSMGEIVTIGLEYGIEPDTILGLYVTLQPSVE